MVTDLCSIVGAIVICVLLTLGVAMWSLWYFVDLPDFSSFKPDISAHPFQPTGAADLPYTTRFQGKLYRWQNTSRVVRGSAYYEMFEDGPWKWDSQGRFAGAGINCGHYFGLSKTVADYEADYYGIDRQNSTLVELDWESDRILDLTHPHVIKDLLGTLIQFDERYSWSEKDMLFLLIRDDKGGNAITDYIGRYARLCGYDGLLFYSARAANWVVEKENNARFGYPFRWDDYYRKSEFINMIIFSGTAVVQRCLKFRIGDEPSMSNPHYLADSRIISDLFTRFGLAYQREREEEMPIMLQPTVRVGRSAE